MALELAFLFAVGSVCGWGLEVLFRRLISTHKWVNPGFLAGPYLPLYGFSLCILYLLAGMDAPLSVLIATAWVRKIVLFICMAAAITLLELVAGMIFVHGMKIKLWDYSQEWGNFKGIICPRFSAIWIVLSALYYFLLHPRILHAVQWLADNLAFSFVIGFFYGMFLMDLGYSLRLMTKIRSFAATSKIVVILEELRADARKNFRNQSAKHRFFFPMHADTNLKEMLEKYRDAHKLPHEHLSEKIRQKREK